MTTKTTTSKSWACPYCGAQDPEHISLVDGLAFRCPVCRTVYIFTSFDEAYKNGWGRRYRLIQNIKTNSEEMK